MSRSMIISSANAGNIFIPGASDAFIPLVNPRQLTGDLETVAMEYKGDQVLFHYTQQTGNITNQNHQRRLDNPDWDRHRDLREVASVPLNVWLLWESMGITNDQRALRQKLMEHKDEYMVVDKKLI